MKITHQGKLFPHTLGFQAKVEDYTLSMGNINATFGAPNEGVYLKYPAFDTRAFWPQLVGPDHQVYKSGYSKATMVRNPTFQVVLKLIAHTVLARKIILYTKFRKIGEGKIKDGKYI